MCPTVINQIAAPVDHILSSQGHGNGNKTVDGFPAVLPALLCSFKFGLGVQIGFRQVVANLAFHVRLLVMPESTWTAFQNAPLPITPVAERIPLVTLIRQVVGTDGNAKRGE